MQCAVNNPLPNIESVLTKQKAIYIVLTPSIKAAPYQGLMALWQVHDAAYASLVVKEISQKEEVSNS